jgi:hypothetical protein
MRGKKNLKKKLSILYMGRDPLITGYLDNESTNKNEKNLKIEKKSYKYVHLLIDLW